eukprot:TRINITY_DN5687_c0_g2_i1.p1 TRINITY_DN5687_c0_g2~~TRINITY_DN5687_c0_g2_i1.p1  ORF type:complete len:791 (+),score=177.12 TRINITY_DN5687_c0_g2_i1:356-2374(+)
MEDRKLCYYNNDGLHEKEVGFVAVNHSIEIETSKKSTFTIISKQARTRLWELRAEKDDIRTEWVVKLSELITRNDTKQESVERSQPVQGTVNVSTPALDRPALVQTKSIIKEASSTGSISKSVTFSPELQRHFRRSQSMDDAPTIQQIFAPLKEEQTDTALQPESAPLDTVRQLQDGDVSMSVYSTGKVLLQEIRSLSFDKPGANSGEEDEEAPSRGSRSSERWVTIKDLPYGLTHHPVLFRSLTDRMASLKEYVVHGEASNTDTLFQALQGKKVSLQTKNVEISAKILSYLPEEKMLLLKALAGDIHFLKTQDILSFRLTEEKDLVSQYFGRPTLDCLIKTSQSEHTIELCYEIGPSEKGEAPITWEAHYTMILNPLNSVVDFDGFYVITNRSGKSFRQAAITLLQRDNSIPLPSYSPRSNSKMKINSLSLNKNGNSRAQSTSDLSKVYYLTDRVDLANLETKEVLIIKARAYAQRINLIRCYHENEDEEGLVEESKVNRDDKYLAPLRTFEAESVVLLRNSKEGGMGVPLPRGEVSLSQRGANGMGIESLMKFTMRSYSPESTISIRLQQLPGMIAHRKQIGFSFDQKTMQITEDIEIMIENNTRFPSDVHVQDQAFRWRKWLIPQCTITQPDLHPDGDKFSWLVRTKGGSKTRLTYTIQYSGFTAENLA